MNQGALYPSCDPEIDQIASPPPVRPALYIRVPRSQNQMQLTIVVPPRQSSRSMSLSTTSHIRLQLSKTCDLGQSDVALPDDLARLPELLFPLGICGPEAEHGVLDCAEAETTQNV
eukprot:1659806-Rhodomonas_salina.1